MSGIDVLGYASREAIAANSPHGASGVGYDGSDFFGSVLTPSSDVTGKKKKLRVTFCHHCLSSEGLLFFE